MHNPLLNLLIRIARGERLTKSTPDERRWAAAMMTIIPGLFLALLVGQRFAHAQLDRFFSSSALTLWIAFVVLVLVLIGCSEVWAKRLPIKVSVILAIVAWSTLLIMLFGLGHWDV